MALPPMDAETTLIIQAQQGDRNAFSELVVLHQPGVIRVVYRMCGDFHLAEDATQDAFIQAWQRLQTFRPGTSLRNWLYRIAINAALDALRRKAPADLREEENDPRPGLEASFIQKERARLVQQAINALPEASRVVLVLREYGELSYADIASTLNIPTGTVMSRLNYAREKLKETLSPHFARQEQTHA